MNIWQIAAGDGSRDYAEIFLKFGVILVAPGSEGDYFKNKPVYNNRQHSVYRPFILTFSEQLQKNDLVILKKPCGRKWEILAVGSVESDYIYSETFGDVDGWEMQHCRKMDWKTPVTKTVISGLRRGTLWGVNDQNALLEAKNIYTAGTDVVTETIPGPANEITVDELIDSIMEQGLPVSNSENIANTIWILRRIAKWYSSHHSDVGEHEIRTFLIVPLLTSLGWAEQRIKIEWNKVDVGFFDAPYSVDSKPVLIIESKRLGHGLLYAPTQAKQYAHKYPTCKLFIVSDGIRYKLYRKENDHWNYAAYMNLMAPKRKHPYLSDVAGSVEFFLEVMP